MRKAIKPFITEHKNGRKPPKPSALFDENDIFGTDERPPRDVNDGHADDGDGGYEAALRAADAIFAKAAPQQASGSTEPATTPSEPEKRVLLDLSYADPLEARLAAAKDVRCGRKPGSKSKPKAAPVHLEAEILDVAELSSPASLPVRSVTMRKVIARENLGFRKQLEARRNVKPGHRWKLKIGTGRAR